MKKRWIVGPVWLVLLLLALSGCFFRAPEDLYQSPQQSADYLSLTQSIRSVKDSLGQEYGVEVEDISVMSGNNTALIQLQDLDGDGVTETAVTFFRVPDADRPLKIYFFTKSSEDTYIASGVVEGSGSSIYRVDYVDLNGSGYKGDRGELADEHGGLSPGHPTRWMRSWRGMSSGRPMPPPLQGPPQRPSGIPFGQRSG